MFSVPMLVLKAFGPLMVIVAAVLAQADISFTPLLAQGSPIVPGGPFDLPAGSDYVLATLIVGFLMPVVISFLSGAEWQPASKAIAAFVWCVVAAVILLVAGDQLHWVRGDFRALFSTFLVVFVMATGLYTFYYKPSGISKEVAKLGVK